MVKVVGTHDIKGENRTPDIYNDLHALQTEDEEQRKETYNEKKKLIMRDKRANKRKKLL